MSLAGMEGLGSARHGMARPGTSGQELVGDQVFDLLSTAVAHTQSAQWFVVQADRDAVARWIAEAIIDLEQAAAALAPVTVLRRPADVTPELAGRDA